MEEDDEFGDLYTDVLSAFPPCSSINSDDLQPQAQVDDTSGARVTGVDEHDDTSGARFTGVDEHDDTSGARFTGVDEHDDTSGARVRDNNNSGVAEDASHVDHQPLIPIPALESDNNNNNDANPVLFHNIQDAAGVDGDANVNDDEWDNDSEDDLQIVLNDTDHLHMPHLGMGMGMNMDGSDDDDEDGEPLIIVADADANMSIGNVEDPSADWAAAVDTHPHPPSQGPSDPTDPCNKPIPPISTPSKLAFPPFQHHPFNSHFKYVRPGATPPAGAAVSAPSSAIRPQLNMSAAHPRPDWHPPSIKPKSFHSSFWSSNLPSRGLDFTLPSHKTIFDVDIDSFEEKPWKYPGIDVSDYFNFGMNEDSWKEYCKLLEQLRLESTMQSKIRVYESGRAEQEYDPDMPPELAAATAIHDLLTDNADITKADTGQGDLDQGSLRVRSSLPTGRPIQVETGCGERFPSIDTRPPRLRDSDAVIEIVLQGSLDDTSADKDAIDHSDNDCAKEDDKGDVDGGDPLAGDEFIDRSQVSADVKEDVVGKRSPVISSHGNGTQDEERDKSPQRTLSGSGYHSGSRANSSTENVGLMYEMRLTKGKTDERSHHMSSGESSLDHHQQEDLIDSMEHKLNPEMLSPNPIKNAQEPSLERNVTLENQFLDEEKRVVSADTSMDKHRLHFTEFQKRSSHVDPPAAREIEDGGDFKVCRSSSDNRKATESSRDHDKWWEVIDEEEVQNGHSEIYVASPKRHLGDGRHDSQRKEHHGRNYLSSKEKEYFPYRNWDPYTANPVHIKSEGMNRKKEKDYSEVSGLWRHEEVRSRRGRAADVRKQDSADELFSSHRGKAREIDRSDKDEYLHSRKLLDSSSWRSYQEKEVGLRYKEKDESLKSRPKVLDDQHRKRRKDELVRREHNEKEDILFSHRESSNTRQKHERDDISSQRKRDDQLRARDNLDDHHSVRFIDEIRVQREGSEQQKERDGWYLSRRERDDGWSPIRNSRNVAEKTRTGHSCGKGEYKSLDKDKRRRSEPLDRMDWVEDDTSVLQKGINDGYARDVQVSNEGKRPRQERSIVLNEHAKDKQRLQEKKHKDSVRKDRESEVTSDPSKRHQGGKDLKNEMGDKVAMNEYVEAERDKLLHVSGASKDNIWSDDEQQQHGSKRGRSTLERWTNPKEREYTKLPSSKMNEISKNKTGGCEPCSGVVEGGCVKNQSKGSGGGGLEGEAKPMPTIDDHLDTVEKLKWRSERFKLPLTNEKDGVTVKKIENENEGLLPLSDTLASCQVKQERPTRKRRWISS